MDRTIRFHSTGAADVLMHEEIETGEPGPGEVRIRQNFAGVNFLDIYHRTGLYSVPSLPATPGVEAVGVVERVGPGVLDFKPGQRVAWAGLPIGGYAQPASSRQSAFSLSPRAFRTACLPGHCCAA